MPNITYILVNTLTFSLFIVKSYYRLKLYQLSNRIKFSTMSENDITYIGILNLATDCGPQRVTEPYTNHSSLSSSFELVGTMSLGRNY